MSDNKVKRLVTSEGRNRVFELEDGTVIERSGGSVSWRNNNPGNLKFEYEGSADKTVHNHRSREQALSRAQHRYAGVVGLDQWGNLVFENYEAGRAAKLELLQRMHGDKTVEAMLRSYSTADYSGETHHKAQSDFIFRQGDRQGCDLRGKTIGEMSASELQTLADGIKGFEGWKVGVTRPLPDRSRSDAAVVTAPVPSGDEDKHVVHDVGRGAPELKAGHRGEAVRDLQQTLSRLNYRTPTHHPLAIDGHFGADTRLAVESFQREHGLHVDGVVGKDTRSVLAATQANPFTGKYHPHHALYEQALHQVHVEESHRHIQSGPHSEALAGALTVAAANQGLSRIDRVQLNDAGTLVRAIQVSPVRDEPGLNHATMPIGTQQAMHTPLLHSSEQLQQGPRHQDVPPHVQASPSMAM